MQTLRPDFLSRPRATFGALLGAALWLASPDGLSAQVTEQDRKAVANQISGRDLASRPPAIASMFLFPVSFTAAGNARLEVWFKEPLPPRLKIILDDKVKELRDDGQGEDWRAFDGIYCARVMATDKELHPVGAGNNLSPSDRFTDLVSSGALRPLDRSGGLVARSAMERGGVPVPLDPTSNSAGTTPLREAFSTSAATASSGTILDPEKALIIRNTDVLNHYFRTTDPCKNVATPPGANPPPPDSARKWSFGYLMTQMTNQSVTKISTSDFALGWLNEWGRDQVLNGERLRPLGTGSNQPPVVTFIKNQWLRYSGNTGKLKMGKAPFRLLAIVNRFDLRTNTAFGGGNAGELRFVFGVLDMDSREPGGQCGSIGQTGSTPVTGEFSSISNVILEFAVDRSTSTQIRAYADAWVRLNSLPQNSSDYRVALEAITESVVKAGAGNIKSRANGSALNVLRVNESHDNNEWDFREFTIDKTTKKLRAQTVANTPAAELNGTDDLVKWASVWSPQINAETHKVSLLLAEGPTAGMQFSRTFLRGSHISTFTGPWAFNADWETQHLFSKNTCNGCHLSENFGLGLAFHIRGRPFSQQAELSPFLLGRTEESDYLWVSDPRNPDIIRHFNELFRRQEHFSNYLSGSSASSLSFQPLTSVH